MRSGIHHRVLLVVALLAFFMCAGELPVSAAQAEGCANEQLRAEQPYGLELPDCRAYEMVSPLDKGDNNIVEGQVRASVSGEAVTYASLGSFAEPVGALLVSRYISRRGPDGWSTRNITPQYAPFSGTLNGPFEEMLFTPDLSHGLLQNIDTPLTSDTSAGYVNLYIADTSSGAYKAVTTVIPPLSEVEPYEPEPLAPQAVGISTDLSHVVFQQYASLTPEASPRHSHVYEWTGGHLVMVDIPPDGITLGTEDNVGAPGDGGVESQDVWHAVSADGSRVIFTGGEALESGAGTANPLGQVYLREVNQGKTVEVSASQRDVADPHGPKVARYWGASTDGSKVFFASRAELTNDANTGSADNASNLYEYDLQTGVLSDLTVDTNIGDTNGASVLGMVTASEDGAYVYFVAEGQLAAGGVSGQPNLYLHHAGKVIFIATLSPASERQEAGYEAGGDSEDWKGAEPQIGQSPTFSIGPGSHTARVTPDGTHLAFESELSLTGYDNDPVEPQDCIAQAGGTSGFGPRPCKEVYIYDVEKGVTCASCDPSGARPIGPAKLGGHEETQEAFGSGSPFYLPQNFSEDGSRLFFQSPDALVQHDSNGRQDVYEYQNGQVYPISNVAGNYASYFLDASSSGNDVFIDTADQLLPSDTDFRADVYDASAVGGFPVSVSPPECTNGDSCKGPVSPQPGVFGAPASATFSGAGNVKPASAVKIAVKKKAKARPRRCQKGHLRKHGRCVKQKARKSVGHSKKASK
jgi:hypothetical protein